MGGVVRGNTEVSRVRTPIPSAGSFREGNVQEQDVVSHFITLHARSTQKLPSTLRLSALSAQLRSWKPMAVHPDSHLSVNNKEIITRKVKP